VDVAPRRKPADADKETGSNPAEKIAGLLAIIVTKLFDTDDAAVKLAAVGFSTREIAALLEVNPNYVNLVKFRRKSRPQRTRRAPKRGSK
jgi:hypothetical protein